MVNKKLQQAGKELGVSEEDLAKIRRERIKRKLLYPFIGAITIACSAGIGFLVGRANPPIAAVVILTLFLAWLLLHGQQEKRRYLSWSQLCWR
jgi:uncharacterized membrane protein YphA (DoxX/SURF4 family)